MYRYICNKYLCELCGSALERKKNVVKLFFTVVINDHHFNFYSNDKIFTAVRVFTKLVP